MLLRFIEFQGDIYLVVGLTYEHRFDPPECYVAVHITKAKSNITRALIENYSVKIPLAYAMEITDKKRLRALMVLYGT